VAVGGSWPGNPDATTVFPQQMLVDYVRVYQRATPSNVGRLPNFDWITAVIAKLPDELLSSNQALISVTAHNQSSNQVSISLSP
jgi:hypothetical protein